MNFIAKKIRWIGLIVLIGFTATAAALYFDAPSKAQKPKTSPAIAAATFVCPMHPEIVSNKPGACPKCEMDLVSAAELSKNKSAHAGCGMSETTESHGCCGAKETTAELTLPPGHPPVAGYTIQQGCNHSASGTNETK
jgi:hypothetical protein